MKTTKRDLPPELSPELAATVAAVKAELVAAREEEERRLRPTTAREQAECNRMAREFQIEIAASLRMFDRFVSAREEAFVRRTTELMRRFSAK